MYTGDTPGRQRFAGGETWTLGAFTEASVDLGRATVTVGGRIDRWHIGGGHLFERDIATGKVLTDVVDPTRSGWLPTARAGIDAPVGGGLKLRSAAYLGWRLPTLNELFRPFRAGRRDRRQFELDPERLRGAEAGIEYAQAPWRASLTVFVNRLGHAIANVTLGQGPGNFPQVGFVAAGGAFRQRQNVDAVKVRGLEASAEWVRGPWALRAGASVSHARMDTSGTAALLDGLRPAQTPKFAATLAASWKQGGKGAKLVLRPVGVQFEDDLNSRSLEGATTIDAYVSWPLTGKLQLVARGENITNKLVMAAVNGDGSIERATPRTLWIGFRLR